MRQSDGRRAALVTGASSGMGEATALVLAGAGTRVAVVARRRDRLEALAGRIRELGGEPYVVVADLTKEAGAQRSVHEAEQQFGHLDILVNYAGLMYLEPVIEADLRRWREMPDAALAGNAGAECSWPDRRDPRGTSGEARTTGWARCQCLFGCWSDRKPCWRGLFGHQVCGQRLLGSIAKRGLSGQLSASL
jgi:NAD(P)-dependent dehydrogenase (short-subunit alcohol dehydrogenase family)